MILFPRYHLIAHWSADTQIVISHWSLVGWILKLQNLLRHSVSHLLRAQSTNELAAVSELCSDHVTPWILYCRM